MIAGQLRLSARVPLLVAALMVLAAAVMSTGVLLRFRQEQVSRIEALENAYLDATASALAPALARADVWEAFDILDRSQRSFGALRLRLAAAVLPNGSVLAATDARRYRVGTPFLAAAEPVPGVTWSDRDVIDSGMNLGRVSIEVDVSELQAERVRVSWFLLAANGAMAIVLAVVGWWLVSRMLRPVQLLTRQLGHGTLTPPTEIPHADFAGTGPEFEALFRSYNAMLRKVGERETLRARLAEEERRSILGTLAGSMAHEVNNPLGGMLTALDTITSHGADEHVRKQSVAFVRRGLEDIRNVVRTSLVLYKAPRGPAVLSRDGLDDLRHLAAPEAARRGVRIAWDNSAENVPVGDATTVRQAILNLLLNAVAASPSDGLVTLSARHEQGRLTISVSDQGSGLPPAMDAMLAQHGQAPPAGTTGLGLWSAVRAARALGGTIRRERAAGTSLVFDIPAGATHAA